MSDETLHELNGEWDKGWSIKEDDTTPIWFLDVDGVINAFASYSAPDNYKIIQASPNMFPGMTDEDIDAAQRKPGGLQRYMIKYDEEIVERIKQLHESGAVRIIWTTTWGEGANGELGNRLGLPRFESLAEQPPRFGQLRGYYQFRGADMIWWKWYWVEKYVNQSPARAFIWTDDDLLVEPDALKWAQAHPKIYAVSPDPNVGLTGSNINSIEKFIKIVK